MKAIAVIGGTGQGKSTFIKEVLLSNMAGRKLIYDVNNEYKTGKALPSIVDFLKTAKTAIKTCIVFEEATIFFSNRGFNDELLDILVRKRHTQNVIILVFHSLRAAPKYVLDMVDTIVLFKTKDLQNEVMIKFRGEKDILAAHERNRLKHPFVYGQDIFNSCEVLTNRN